MLFFCRSSLAISQSPAYSTHMQLMPVSALRIKIHYSRGKHVCCGATEVNNWRLLFSPSPTSPTRFCLQRQNHHGRLVVLQTHPDHLGTHPTMVPRLSLRMSLLQPHSGVRLTWDQRNPTRCPFHHWGQLANRQKVRALAVSALHWPVLPASAVFSWLPLWSILITLKWISVWKQALK